MPKTDHDNKHLDIHGSASRRDARRRRLKASNEARIGHLPIAPNAGRIGAADSTASTKQNKNIENSTKYFFVPNLNR